MTGKIVAYIQAGGSACFRGGCPVDVISAVMLIQLEFTGNKRKQYAASNVAFKI